MLREIAPGETKQGNIVFDVPLASYRLRLTDGGEPGSEKLVWVEIPLRIDTDSSVDHALAGTQVIRRGWLAALLGGAVCERPFRLPRRFRSTASRCISSKTGRCWDPIMLSCPEKPCSSVAA